MTKLIGLLALAGAIAAAVFFWRRNEEPWESMWTSTRDAASSWGKTVAHEAGNATDTASTAVTEATNTAVKVADKIKDVTADTADDAGKAAKKGSAAAADAASAL